MSVLIIAKPGPLRDSLYFMLRMMPGIDTIDYTSSAAWALRAVVEHRPELMVVDAGTPDDDALSLVQKLASNGSRCPCLVLVDHVLQQQRFRSAGADVVLLKGYPAVKLLGVIAELLDGQVETLTG